MKQYTAIINSTQGEGHGAERVLGQLLSSFPEPSTLFIIAPKNSSILRLAQNQAIPCVELPSQHDSLLQNIWALIKIKRKLPPLQNIHCWSARSFELGLYLKGLKNIPLYGTLHDYPNASFHGPLRQKLMKICSAKFNHLACVSASVKKACHHAGYRCPCQIIYNGQGILHLNRIPSDHIRIGFLGMYADWKGFSIIASWIEQLQLPAIEWHLYGKATPSNKQLAQSLMDKYGKLVSLHGRKDPQEIFSSIDILLHASLEPEPFGMVITEAAEAGLAIVASSLGGPSENYYSW